ncbi:MAG: hypothetical protein LCH57_02595, partial [Proteobacteria bacterium]|nr:hypothetical protein [Pseudomonadota bacterium]
AGYFLGGVALVADNLEAAILLIVLLSVVPMVIEYLRHRRDRGMAPEEVVRESTEIVDEVEDSVLEMEQKTLDAFLTRAEIRRLFTVRRELLKFRRILGPMEEATRRLQSLDLPCIDADVRPYFRDVSDHVQRVGARLGGLNDILSSVFEVANLLEQQRQGGITRKLASWAALLAVPTAIAGVYGMNFEFMPELHWRYGYYGALILMLTICAGLFVTFKRTKWL